MTNLTSPDQHSNPFASPPEPSRRRPRWSPRSRNPNRTPDLTHSSDPPPTSNPTRSQNPPPAPHQRSTKGSVLGTALLAALALLALILIVVLTPASRPSTHLGADNPSPRGAMALLNVLRNEGVKVVTPTNPVKAASAAGPEASLAIVGWIELGVDEVRELTARAAHVVLVDGMEGTREALTSAKIPHDVLDDLQVMNGTILEEDKIAPILRTLGRDPTLVWYIPTESDEAWGVEDADLFALFPPWVSSVIVMACVTAIGAALWRGRRFGKLVPEALPVIVPASEVTRGLGELYHRNQARGHAAAALRAGAISRLAARAGIAPSAEPATVVTRIAETCGGDAATIHHLLYGPAPRRDADLVRLAQALAALTGGTT